MKSITDPRLHNSLYIYDFLPFGILRTTSKQIMFQSICVLKRLTEITSCNFDQTVYTVVP